MSARLRVGAPPDLHGAVLSCGLDLPPWSERVEFVREPPARLAAGMRAGELDIALLPLHEALRDQAYDIVPGLSVCSLGAAGIAALHRWRALPKIARIAAREPGHVAGPLVRALFAASGVNAPELVSWEGPPEAARAVADAVLVTGDDALRAAAGEAQRLDLGGAWTSLTRQPFVWSLWAARPGTVDRPTYALLHAARTRGRHDLERLVQEHARATERDLSGLLRQVHESVVYRLGRRQLAAIEEFWTTAAGAGILPAWLPVRFVPFAGACDPLSSRRGRE
ncbi:MAG: hypothetical protein KBD01_09560 [Acidobacteria bacterium]|nr:hypothetical protein [Acidobacteriota bacterium]